MLNYFYSIRVMESGFSCLKSGIIRTIRWMQQLTLLKYLKLSLGQSYNSLLNEVGLSHFPFLGRPFSARIFHHPSFWYGQITSNLLPLIVSNIFSFTSIICLIISFLISLTIFSAERRSISIYTVFSILWLYLWILFHYRIHTLCFALKYKFYLFLGNSLLHRTALCAENGSTLCHLSFSLSLPLRTRRAIQFVAG